MSNLPTVTSNIPRDLRNFVDRLRDMINGGGSNSLVSAQDLVSAGIANLSGTGVLSAAVQPTTTTSYGTPPAPTTVAASAAIQNVIVTWDTPDYPGHAYAEVWGSSTNNIGAAVALGQAPGAVYTDPLGPSATRYYWVRFVNVDGATGAFNGLTGVGATTAADLAYTMDVLSDAYGVTSAAPFFQLDAPTVINGVTIPAGTYMKAAYIYDGVITNAKIGNAAVDNAKIANLDAGKITTGYISADRVQAGSLDAKLASIDAAVIGSGFINAARIQDASITNAKIVSLDASKISVSSLSALSANMGTITAGSMQSTDGKFVVDLDNKTISITV